MPNEEENSTKEQARSYVPINLHPTLLSQSIAAMQAAKRRYMPGDFVKWKDGLQNRAFPLPGYPAIVVQHLDAAVLDPGESSLTYFFREPLDLIVGVISPNGGYIEFYLDSRRVTPYEAGSVADLAQA